MKLHEILPILHQENPNIEVLGSFVRPEGLHAALYVIFLAKIDGDFVVFNFTFTYLGGPQRTWTIYNSTNCEDLDEAWLIFERRIDNAVLACIQDDTYMKQ